MWDTLFLHGEAFRALAAATDGSAKRRRAVSQTEGRDWWPPCFTVRYGDRPGTFAFVGVVSWYDAGARSFYARQPVRSLNDLQGKTIRVQDSQIVIDMIRLLGAVPETTAYSDVYSALETGQIDAAENNWPAYYSMEHYKVARYYMADEHSRVPEVQLASGRTWDALPEEYRQILQACARASAQYERQLWAQEETAARKAQQIIYDC